MVVKSISSLVEHPNPQYVYKYLIEGNLNQQLLAEKYKLHQYTDYITFLLTNNPDNSRSVGKRVY